MRIIKIQVRVKYCRCKLIISIFVLVTLFENRDAEKSDEMAKGNNVKSII